ncbi:ependymin-like 1 [Takifugu flavidus]|uniref:ependymin-like 1 n=1 Tax=Takifugu flavidus TaxID=433684 RepID=UPI0025441D45|nr:ependymin-like 1 [Takifugu flavidus]XP_056883652.1 ependymin-like 1 [Takifugu flavidus]
MKVFLALTALLATCLAQEPHPCRSPPLLTGELSVSTQNEKLWMFARYEYDALGQRIRIMEFGTYENKTFTFDALLHFRKGIMYEINRKNKTCKKSPLKTDFQPMSVPKDASLLGQAILGSSSAPGQGLLVNTWMGDLPKTGGKYLMTFTEFGCIPISTAYQTGKFGWSVTSFFNNVIGITDPGQLNPPSFCPKEDTEFDPEEEPRDFLSLFRTAA